MLRVLRLQALDRIGNTRACLATSGPGGLQASNITFRVRGECLYLLLPAGSDHLANLEQSPELLLTTEDWQVRGLGICLPPRQDLGAGGPYDLASVAGAAGQVLVEVDPLRIHLGCGASAYHEMIDFSCQPPAGGQE
jgi:hypothetical protein